MASLRRAERSPCPPARHRDVERGNLRHRGRDRLSVAGWGRSSIRHAEQIASPAQAVLLSSKPMQPGAVGWKMVAVEPPVAEVDDALPPVCR